MPAEPIAVVGSSCRVPGATSPSGLWDLLQKPRDLLRKVPDDRFHADAFYHPDGEHHGSANVTQSYFLADDIRRFDYNFFHIHPREAEAMDPQQRLLLETVYETVEAAGYSLDGLRGSDTAVFVGQMTGDYADVLGRDVDTVPPYVATGVSRAIMANRVSYFFDWKGASVCLDTACSSSLVAVHQAVQDLRAGVASAAIAAGVNLILGPELYIFESKLHMLSPTGRSRMWDAGADGYARGEGVAAVLLKTLSQALADGDHIECLIRETGVNQDGRTPGITMPSPHSQAALIRATYARAGLDPRRPEDRCQYFEAHGTGTLAGDPVEAEAVHAAFFGDGLPAGNEPLWVGSVKTVIGHLEGAAGVAGLLKASLAVQHGVIPPNMHFQTLNPKIEPFYGHLRVPTEPIAWPALPSGAARRVSVNSFGFGGTNAHAIVENWTGEPERRVETTVSIPYGPLPLSANSPSALTAAVSDLHGRLADSGDDLSLGDLAWTLQQRRGAFPHRTYVSGADREQLLASLSSRLAEKETTFQEALPVTANLPPRILGVFTGQGAQWPAMGARLYAHSALFRRSLQQLEASLATLPVEADRPAWSLTEELRKPAGDSRMHEAALAQPLCTALQVALVDLLRAAGIAFAGVVGHSSGEIAAAYAVGYLTAGDAVRIAYYRGLHATRARSQAGRMLAVGMGYDQAVSFCQEPPFAGRIVAAASNARSSTTLSGDQSAIEEAKARLEADGVFARLLQVDTAYHSHHMQACAEPYLDSLKHCGIDVQAQAVLPDAGHTWFSSVHGPDGRSRYEPARLADTYWVDNMVQPVLFAQALDRAVAESPHCFDLVLEIGPHPALQGPSRETLRTLTGLDLPYSGVLRRGTDDVQAFSDALGFVWAHFQTPAGHAAVDFTGFRRACIGDADAETDRPKPVKGLSAYRWDHDVPLWKESRQSKKYRLRAEPAHELLGTVAASSGNGQEVRWRNILKLGEMGWLRGHQFQNQVLFPAAGYVSMAVEAAVRLARTAGNEGDSESEGNSGSPSPQIVELQDLQIHTAITIEDDAAGAEVVFVIRATERSADRVVAEFACYSGSVDGQASDVEKANFSGRAVVTLGTRSDPTALPARTPSSLPMDDVDLDRFYGALEKTGLVYSGDFLMQSAKRRLDASTVNVNRVADSTLLVHPATLDAAFHGLFAAFCFPGDGRMWTSYLPTGIRTVRVNVAAAQDRSDSRSNSVVADCFLRQTSNKIIAGDLDVFSAEDPGRCEVQVTGLVCSSFTKPHARNDRSVFSHTVWRPDISAGISPEDQPAPVPEEFEVADLLDRISVYYLRRLRAEITPAQLAAAEWHLQSLWRWAVDYVLPRVESGRHRRIQASSADDTAEMVAAWAKEHRDVVDMEIVVAVGEQLPAIVRGQVPALQILMENDRLNRLYKQGLGFDRANEQFRQLVAQMSHRHPRLRVLEIGAGTGGATVAAMRGLSPHFVSYTYTDISPGFFEKARALFTPEQLAKMDFRVLDIERDPVEQGFPEHGFDLVLASNVLHATRFLGTTLAHCRRLLRPGGRMVLIEITGDAIHTSFSMSGLQGWWLGKDDGRVYGPLVSEARWDALMVDAGFSGVDVTCTDLADYYCSVLSTQAVDDRVALLREPLTAPAGGDTAPPLSSVVIVGGQTLPVARTAQAIRRQLRRLVAPGGEISLVSSIEDLADQPIAGGTAVLSLADLDEPLFQDMTEAKFAGMHNMVLGGGGVLLWVTQGRRAEKPYANMVVGMGRSIALESPHLVMQFLDLDSFQGGGSTSEGAAEATVLAEAFVRLVYLSQPAFEDVLWTREHELALEGSRLFIPRVLPHVEANDRLNAERRPILCDVSLAAADKDTGVQLVEDQGKLVLQEIPPFHFGEDPPADAVRVQLFASSVYPLRTRDHQNVFVGAGVVVRGKKKVLVLSSDLRSVVRVPQSRVYPLEWSPDNVAGLLQSVLVDIQATSLTRDVDGTLWVHGSSDDLATRLVDRSFQNGQSLLLTSSQTSPALSASPTQVFIHPYDTERTISGLLPSGPLTFAHVDQNGRAPALDRIVCRDGITVRPVFRQVHGRTSVALNLSLSDLHNLLSGVQNEATSPTTTNFRLAGIVNQSLDTISPTQTITWPTDGSIPAQLYPTGELPLFRSHRTYFLVGLTGELGLSLCAWMVDHGARYIAVASRSPQVSPAVLDDLKRRGAADVRVFALDIADRQALHDVYYAMRRDMPPVAGVANAAMVLRDRPFDNCSLDDFRVVLGPKVTGSEHLDALFSHPGELDFFVLFSSLSCVIGNKAQSNYGAANLFMHALANQRRRRGLPASIMDIAMLLGVGYVARALDQYESRFIHQYNYMALSEPEMHRIFATAILAGHPTAGARLGGPELITGLLPDTDKTARDDPRFCHNITDEQGSGGDGDGDGNEAGAELSTRVLAQLERATASAQETAGSDTGAVQLAVLEAAFSRKVELILQLPADKVDARVPLIKLGIDSLVAVELRSWFLKELRIEMAVLKFLGGASISDICQEAVGQLSGVLGAAREAPAAKTKTDGNTARAPSTDTTDTTDTPTPQATSQTTPTPPESEDGLGGKYERVGPMSASQARIFFLHEYLEDKSTYNIVMGGRLQGTLQVAVLQAALRSVARQHESLRSSFFLDPATGTPVQAVAAEPHILVEQHTIGSAAEKEAAIDSLRRFVFDVHHGQTMKVLVLTEHRTVHHLVFAYHHLVLDGHSWLLFLRDLDRAYSSGGRLLTQQQPGRQAIDVAAKQLESRQVAHLQTELQFWRALYAGRDLGAALPLFPFARVPQRRVLRRYDTHTAELLLNGHWTRAVKAQSAALRVTPFHFYLAGLSFLLAHGLGVDDVSIGIVDAARADDDELSTLGCFVNLLPARFRVPSDATFDQLVGQTRDDAYACLAHARVPFDVLLDQLQVPRSGRQNPLFQIALNYRLGVSASSRLGPHDIAWTTTVAARNPYDVVIDVTETPDGAQICLSTQEYLYSADDTRRLLTWYHRVLRAAVAEPTALSVASYRLCTPEEDIQTGALSKGPVVSEDDDDWGATLAHRIARVARDHADDVAIRAGEQDVTYAEMATRTASIAHALRALLPGDRVAVLLPPSVDAVCAILAIMHLGLVYVPLDPRNPPARLGAMVADSQPSAIVAQNATLAEAEALLAYHATTLVDLDRTPAADGPTPEIRAAADQVGFLLYTSGSTGTPKGVLLTHAGYHNQIRAITTEFAIGRETVLQQTSCGFDVALEQMLLPLANAGTTVIVPATARGDPVQIARLVRAAQVTYTIGVPSEYLTLLRYGGADLRQCPSWRIAVTCGEKETPALRRAFRDLALDGLQLVSSYGPTEVSMSCLRGALNYSDADTSGYLGRPLANYVVSVLDAALRPVPVGFPGEICIGGIGLAPGYLKRPEEIARAFVASPADGSRLYRSGDKGRVLDDGTVWYLGRIDGDSQVKINGVRIELDEIAQVLLHEGRPYILDAAVSWRPDVHLLVAFVLLEKEADSRPLDALLARLPLPANMRPDLGVPVADLPRTINGKRDRAAIDRLPLPAPSATVDGASASPAPLTPEERRIKETWEAVLPAADLFAIEADSDFFHVGGSSLLLIQLQAALQAAWGGRRIPLPDLFQASTLRAMAVRVQQEGPAEDVAVDWADEVATLLDGLPGRSKAAADTGINTGTGLRVLLTGATGFLGRHILRLLAADDRVTEIHCVAVRPAADGQPRVLDSDSPKITAYVGDLAAPRLGLSPADFQRLSDTTDVAIHNGADVSFLKTYQTLRSANVLATRSLLALALPRGVPLHYVSTAAVARFWADADGSENNNGSLGEVSVAAYPPPAQLSAAAGGYLASKWVAEALLEKAALKHDLPAWIHRPTSIVGAGAPSTDVVTAILQHSQRLGAVPRVGDSGIDIVGRLDVVPVETVAGRLVAVALGAAARDSSRVAFVHHCSDEPVDPAGLQTYVQQQSGRATPVEEWPADRWLSEAQAGGLDPALYAYLTSAVQDGQTITLPLVTRA